MYFPEKYMTVKEFVTGKMPA